MSAPTSGTTPRSVQAAEAETAGWCMTHGDFAWIYDDGSVGCFYCQTVEMSSADCVAEPRVLVTPQAEAALAEALALLARLTEAIQTANIYQTKQAWDKHDNIVDEARAFLAAHGAGEAYCVHDELPGDCDVCRRVGDIMPEPQP